MPTPPVFTFKTELLEYGQELLRVSGIGGIVQARAADLLAELARRKPVDGTAVQEQALLVLADYVRERPDLVDILDRYLTANPRFHGNPVNARDLVFLGSVALRDLYFAKHPEITD